MRAPSDMPRPGGGRRRKRREPKPGRGRVVLIVAAVVLFLLITSLRSISRFYTDFLWFDSLGQSAVFTGVLQAKVTLVAIFAGTFFVLLWLNLFLADRVAPAFRIAGPEEELVERYHQLVGGRTVLVRTAVSVLFALIAGAGMAGEWRSWILFHNAVDFGEVDPQFKRDIGFYIFRLPFLSTAVGWLFTSIVIVLIVTAVAHYLNGGIRLQTPGAERVTAQVKVHLSVLLGALALVKAGDYWLQQFQLTVSSRGTVDGANYTAVNAELPALRLLIFIAVGAFFLFIWNIWRKGWVLPALAVGLWAFIQVVAGGIVPAVVQRYKVEPSESSQERPFLLRNMQATTAALGLDDVRRQPFAADDSLDDAALQRNEQTLRNIRLWDPSILVNTYEQLQALRPFYGITDVDVDRYLLDGELTQLMVSARELDTANVPQRSWEARHLTFTHGYGVVAAPSNAKDSGGRPSPVVSDVPLQVAAEAQDVFDISQPGIYFGEGLSSYVIVDTNRREIDFQDAQNQTQFTEYTGDDGVNIGSITRRLAFALRFADVNPLFSGNLRSDSRILLFRDVHDRVSALAPFLDFDSDPYPVVVDGRIQWVLDGYTTSDRYPYGETATTDGPSSSGLNHRFNYVRNSVKAVVDAYDGTVTFYVIDDDDPITRAYSRAFPDLFTTTDPPAALAAHFRYPEDLFRVQTNMWGRYHLEDPDDFYTRNGAWVVSRNPSAPSTQTPVNTGSSSTSTTDPNAPPRTSSRMDPYYLLTRLPDREEQAFILLRPFVPFSQSDSRQLLTGFLVADSDPGSYGRLTSYETDPTQQVDGPGIVAGTINSDDQVSRDQTQLCQQGASCRFGNLILVPIEGSLLYVQPLYIIADQNPVPLLRKVIVQYQGEVSIADSLREALIGLRAFENVPATLDDTGGAVTPTPPGEEPTTPPSDVGIVELLQQAEQLFAESDAALAEQDFATYGEKLRQARALIERARQLAAESTTTTTAAEPA